MTLSGLPAAWWGLIKQVATSWLDDYVPSMGAALAYYTMFSLAPLLLIVVSVAGLVFGEDAARGEIQAQLQDLMGERGAGAVQDLLASVREPAEGLTATAVGLVLLSSARRPCLPSCRTRSTGSGGCRGGSARAGGSRSFAPA